MQFRILLTIVSLGILEVASATPLRIVCIGDSITQAFGDRGSNGGYSYRYWL